MRSYYAGMKLISLDWRQQNVKSRPPCNFKTGHFKSLVGKKRLQNNARANKTCKIASFRR